VDANDDGIGDVPYNILGTANSSDHFPIWDDGIGLSKLPPLINKEEYKVFFSNLMLIKLIIWFGSTERLNFKKFHFF